MNANEARSLADDYVIREELTLLRQRAKEGFYCLEQPVPLTLEKLNILTNRGYEIKKVVSEDGTEKYNISFKTNVYTRR